MSYEAGSKECRHLIEAKESLLSALDALSNINSTDLIQIQIKEIYYLKYIKNSSVLIVTLIKSTLIIVIFNTEQVIIFTSI